MTLFEECKEALSADFIIVKGRLQKDAIDIFNKYPLVNGNISWSEIEYSDYEDINHLLNANSIENDNVFVFVDDVSIPIFRSNLNLLSENIHDVTALSPKLFIFNNDVILQPLFPTEMFRLGINSKKEHV
ncbi:hypothetical protein BF17_04770 [Yersinia similis]|uniref:Uncharacterized protein n=1 Tax=Yersinia similis TaxID=367190 RepID=A0ABM5PX60_9GAMM|nr:hypothetical protein [Yersinia similis]AHK18722.1 hypothetical protein BF17_04770 [Yersinia similis]CFQ73855.1 Uncharacterised protein [Yersinia similis]CNC69013.1 Uncharacterised protein [Yersinia similis]